MKLLPWRENPCHNHVTKSQKPLQCRFAANERTVDASGTNYGRRLALRFQPEFPSGPKPSLHSNEDHGIESFFTFASRQARFNAPVIASLLIRFPLSRVNTSPLTFLIFDCFLSLSISSRISATRAVNGATCR